MIKIYTFSHKRPDFLELQLKSFKKNLKEEFEFIVFNNATFDLDRIKYNQIHEFCKQNNLKCIDIEKDYDLINRLQPLENVPIFNNEKIYTNSVIACAYPLCYAWKNFFCDAEDKICIIDSDMFIMEPEELSANLDKYDIIYMPQSKGPNGEVYYMWNGFVLMNLKNVPNKNSLNWWCGNCDGFSVDVGGHTFYYLKENKDKLRLLELKLHYVAEDPSCNFSPANYEYLAINDAKFILHYRGASWDNSKSRDYYLKKDAWLKNKL